MSTDSVARPRGLARHAPVLALSAACLYLLIVAALHVLQPETDPFTEPVSAYAHGRGGPALQVGIFSAGAGALALVVAIIPLLARTRSRARLALGTVTLGIYGIAQLAQAFFPIDDDGATTAIGAVHNALGNLVFFIQPVAAVLVGTTLAHLGGSRAPAVLGWLLAAMVVMVLLAANVVGFFGLAQRLYLTTAAVWVIMSAVAVRVIVALGPPPASRLTRG
ncbi:DUF998 domain-containing protein [Kocuria coralli]|uniref:DUF998 domain-containing protein n=1 Tax=Kocuria coralli TaxID=1461025 RepID=A0A5J5KTF7_9MICC|nr:DUF998 domain-containing protein [Kocuria coralli]KAA9393057.1 DUF998 domain-containing protein [Kocuria coralli]